MQEREQKWYSGMLGVTFNADEGRITIFRSMLEAAVSPTVAPRQAEASPSQNNPSSAVKANRGAV